MEVFLKTIVPVYRERRSSFEAKVETVILWRKKIQWGTQKGKSLNFSFLHQIPQLLSTWMQKHWILYISTRPRLLKPLWSQGSSLYSLSLSFFIYKLEIKITPIIESLKVSVCFHFLLSFSLLAPPSPSQHAPAHPQNSLFQSPQGQSCFSCHPSSLRHHIIL